MKENLSYEGTQFDNVDLDISVKSMGFNVRTLNAFEYYNRSDSPLRERLGPIETLGDFRNYTAQNLGMFRNLGEASLKHIVDVLAKYHIQILD